MNKKIVYLLIILFIFIFTPIKNVNAFPETSVFTINVDSSVQSTTDEDSYLITNNGYLTINN